VSKSDFLDLYQRIEWSGGKNLQLTPFQRLAITMVWMRNYPSNKMLAWMIGVDPSTISRITSETVDLLWKAVHKEIAIPVNLTDRLQTAKRVWRYLVVMVIDGTEQHVLQSVKKQKANCGFNGIGRHNKSCSRLCSF